MSVINHIITNNGQGIIINEEKGFDKAFVQYEYAGVTTKLVLIEVAIARQNKEFMITYVERKYDGDDNIISSIQKRIGVSDETYDSYYDVIEENLAAMQSIDRRALNGLLEHFWGKGFYAFNPINDLEPMQPVVFTLSVEIEPTEGNNDGKIASNITDGSGSYDYSIDDGATWGTAARLNNLGAGDYEVYVRDKGVSNAWYRSQSITLINQTPEE